MADHSPITLKKIAEKAGLAVSTVSYALRNSPQVSRATCLKVQSLARELGYRPNTRVAGLMSHIRQAHSRQAIETIAFIWVDCDRLRSQQTHFFQLLIFGARKRADQIGYKLQEFWLEDPGMSPRRIRDILLAQGITGIIFSAATMHDSINLGIDLSPFASAVIGSTSWTPECHRTAHDHYGGMMECLSQLSQTGIERPAAIIDPSVNERCRRSYEAAFNTFAPQPTPSRYLRLTRWRDGEEMVGWLRSLKTDGLIINSYRYLGEELVKRLQSEMGLPIVSLYLRPNDPDMWGIDQCYDQIAANAVDLVAGQLNNNEYGTPTFPHVLHFSGRWAHSGNLTGDVEALEE